MSDQDTMRTYQMLLDFLTDDSNDDKNTEDDKTFRKKTTVQITKRDEKYTELLEHFVRVTQIRNNLKEFFKWTFYLVIIVSMVMLATTVYDLFKKYTSSADIEQILESTPLLITSMVGFVSTIITIPVTITKYLFSTKEDKNITDIILHTQDHDTSGRQWAMDFKEIAEEFEKNNNQKSRGRVI